MVAPDRWQGRFVLTRLTIDIPVSAERMMENALDWEHLPYQHGSTFFDVQLLESQRDSWLAMVGVRAPFRHHAKVQLTLDRQHLGWWTDILSGWSRGFRVWAQITEVAHQQIRVEVVFTLPWTKVYLWPLRGLVAASYRQLYREDIAMMVERQQQLARRREVAALSRQSRVEPRLLGHRNQLREGLCFQVGHESYRAVLYEQDRLLVYGTTCPHMLAKLDRVPMDQRGIVVCPWHNYRFDVATGECLDQGKQLQLAAPPKVHWRGDSLWLGPPAAP